MDKEMKRAIIRACLIGFGTALAVSGFISLIAAVITFSAPRLVAAVIAFGIGLSTMFFWAELGADDK